MTNIQLALAGLAALKSPDYYAFVEYLQVGSPKAIAAFNNIALSRLKFGRALRTDSGRGPRLSRECSDCARIWIHVYRPHFSVKEINGAILKLRAEQWKEVLEERRIFRVATS